MTSYDDSTVDQRHQVLLPRRGGQQRRRGHAVERGLGHAGAAPPPPLPFPRTAVLDNFARPAGALGTSWQSPGLADPGTVTIAEQRPDHEQRRAQLGDLEHADLRRRPGGLPDRSDPAGGRATSSRSPARVSTLSAATVSCYFLRVTPSTEHLGPAQEAQRRGLDVDQDLHGSRSPPATAPGLQIIGSTLTAYRKPGAGAWTSVGSATDTAIPGAGYVSFTLGDTTMRGGAFGGGTIN